MSDEELLTAYSVHEAQAEVDTPAAKYSSVLADAFVALGNELGVPVSGEDAVAFGDSVPSWPAFSDSAEALARLAKRYKLIILSNVHRAGFAGSNEQLKGDFAAILTAEDIGSYKPARQNFEALAAKLDELEIPREKLLHVAQSLFHDHVPAKEFGLPTVWINRRHDQPGWGATPNPQAQVTPDWEFASMAEFADAVDAES
jgi:putative hydrolase of the HAD superfamily